VCQVTICITNWAQSEQALFATIDLGLGLCRDAYRVRNPRTHIVSYPSDQGVLLFQQPTFEAIVDKVGLNDAGLATSMIADVIIASAMVFALRSKRSDMPRTKSIMSRLITFAIGTSLLTTCGLPTDAAPKMMLMYQQSVQCGVGDTSAHAQ
jgi:hypothetical protein